MLCYCASGKVYAECCEPLIEGTQMAANPEQLMRSRYSAYVLQNIAYLKATLTPKDRATFRESDTREWAKAEWQGLHVISAEGNTVEFTAKYKMNGKDYEHHEVSTFKKIDGKWFFLEGDSHVHEDGKGHHHHHAPIAPIVREEPKINRNDPCVCGSGKKYKKCCAA
jgi:SEC-C motif domain protein